MNKEAKDSKRLSGVTPNLLASVFPNTRQSIPTQEFASATLSIVVDQVAAANTKLERSVRYGTQTSLKVTMLNG